MQLQSVAVISLVGLAGAAGFSSLGDAVHAALDERVGADRVAVGADRVAVGEESRQVTSSPQELPAVGASSAAMLNVSALLRMVDRLPAEARAGIDAYDYERAMASAIKHERATTIGRALVPEALPNVAAPVSHGHAPAPNQYATAMELISKSKQGGNLPLKELRMVYNDALTDTVPTLLKTLREQMTRAFVHTGTDPGAWLRHQERAEQLVDTFQGLTHLSARDIQTLVEVIESAKYATDVELRNPNFTPIFSQTLVPAQADDFVDAMIAARRLHQQGHEVNFPYVIAPPYGSEGNTIRYRPTDPTAAGLTNAATHSGYVQDLFEIAAKPRFTPERARRRALVNETFPGSRLYEASPDDARAIIAATYDKTSRHRQQNRFGEWWVKVRESVVRELSTEQKTMVRKITSLPRILFGINTP